MRIGGDIFGHRKSPSLTVIYLIKSWSPGQSRLRARRPVGIPATSGTFGFEIIVYIGLPSSFHFRTCRLECHDHGMRLFAHSLPGKFDELRWEPLETHLHAVAARARSFAAVFRGGGRHGAGRQALCTTLAKRPSLIRPIFVGQAKARILALPVRWRRCAGSDSWGAFLPSLSRDTMPGWFFEGLFAARPGACRKVH